MEECPAAMTESPQTEQQTVTLAALCFELGRMQARALGEEGRPEVLMAQWLRSSAVGLATVAAALEYWHPLLEEAARLAAGGERPAEPSVTARSYPLASPFAKVTYEGRGGENLAWFYDPQRQFPACNYPSTTPVILTQKIYVDLWNAFCTDFHRLPTPLTPDDMLVLLERHTSFLPLVPRPPELPLADVALFDHIKTMAALALCLYQRRQENWESHDLSTFLEEDTDPHSLLVGGDFSGVQDFIYRIFSKGALKALRGRSFFVELLTEHVISEILTSLGLSRTHVLYAGGARFTLLLPHTTHTVTVVQTIAQRMNAYFRKAHEAKLYLVLEMAEFTSADLMPSPAAPHTTFARVWGTLTGNIARQKSHKFQGMRQSHGAEGVCQWCQQPTASALLVEVDECHRWGIDNGPVCSFCFLFLPKVEPTGYHSARTFFPFTMAPEAYSAGGTCPWCHHEGLLQELILDEERLFGCDQRHCLGLPPRLDACQVCRRLAPLTPLPPMQSEVGTIDAGDEAVWTCGFCRNLYHLGEHLPYLRYILRSQEAPRVPQRVFMQIGQTFYYFPLPQSGQRPETFGPADFTPEHRHLVAQQETQVWRLLQGRHDDILQEWRLNHCTQGGQLSPLLLGAYRSPQLQSGTFDELAEGLGARRLSVLRMDVDNLGDVLQGAREMQFSLARTSMLARLLSEFFKFHINQVCQGQELPNMQQLRLVPPSVMDGHEQRARHVMIIYSGGDDLFIIGHWHEVAELTFDLYAAFKQYTCATPALSLSGGFVVQSPDFPLYHMAQRAADAEDEAKGHTVIDAVGTLWQKNALAPFFKSQIFGGNGDLAKAAFKWESPGQSVVTAMDVRDLVAALIAGLGQPADVWKEQYLPLREGIPRGFLQKLFEVIRLRAPDRLGKLSLPALRYALGQTRGLPPDLVSRLKELTTVDYLHPALLWVDLLSRKDATVQKESHNK
jgi:hypothetical protein